MTNRDKLIQQLTRHEGFRSKAYRCPAGKLTIGIGRNLDDVGVDAKEAEFLFNLTSRSKAKQLLIRYGITRTQANHLLKNDIDRIKSQLKILPFFDDLDEIRQCVLINMGFNMGVDGLLGFKKTLALIQKKEYMLAAVEMLDSKWKKDVGQNRANELSMQLSTGQWQEQWQF